MINISTEYQQTIVNKRKFQVRADIRLRDGTVLNVDNSQIMQTGTSIDDGVSGTSSFDIGSAIINKLTLTLNNMYDTYSSYDFTDSVITVFIGLQLSDHIEWLKKGVFTADDPAATPSILRLEALDNMSKFDKVYDGNLTFPATLQTIVRYCCNKCGVLLLNSLFPNYGYVVVTDCLSDKKDITYRAILGYCVQIVGCYARCNVDGKLEIKWYDTAAFTDTNYTGGSFDKESPTKYQTGDTLSGGNFTNYTIEDAVAGGTFTAPTKYHHIYSLSSLETATDDVIITGVRVTASDGQAGEEKLEGETFLSGTEGYVLEISGNPVIEYDRAFMVANYLGGRLIGMKFRPLKASCLGDPSWEAGDAALVTDRKNNSYPCYLTNLSYSVGSYANISCDATPPARNSSKRYDAMGNTIAGIKKDIKHEIGRYDTYVNGLNDLAMNALGYYETNVKQDDGSTIKYMHDKPVLSESMIIYKRTIDGFFLSRDGGTTYTAGFDKDGNAVLNVLAAIGIESEWIDTRGFTASDNDGNVTLKIDAETGNVEIHPNTFTLSGKTVQEIADDSSTAAQENAKDYADGKLSDYAAIVTGDIQSLQEQIDGNITSWFYGYEPTTRNLPASEWTTEALKTQHLGDLFYNTDTGYGYRYMLNGSIYQWGKITDTDVVKALADAQKAQDTADGKRRVFIGTPAPPYDIGDLWSDGPNGELMRCVISRQIGSYESTDWDKACKYTDDTATNNLDDSLDFEGVFNRLTKNGAIGGIYMQKGQLFINATYIKSGTLKLGGNSNINGSLIIYDGSNNIIGRWDNNGVYIANGSFYSKTGTTETSLYDGKMHISYSGSEIGFIGSNYMDTNPSYKGLVFDLETNGKYMAWGYRKNASDSFFTIMLSFYSQAYIASNPYAGIHLGHDLYSNGYTISLDSRGRTWTKSIANGAGIQTKDYLWIVDASNADIAEFGQSAIYLVKNTYAKIVGTPSDTRLKDNINNSPKDALAILSNMNFREFDWIESGEHESLGLIAQEVEQVEPELVNESEDDTKHINPTRLLWYCAKAIKQLNEKIEPSKPIAYRMASRTAAIPEYTLEEKKAWIAAQKEKNKRIDDEPIVTTISDRTEELNG